jgi:hypothetical protein
MKKTPWLVAALLVLPLPAPAADPIDALGRFVGTWTSTGEFVKSAYSKASAVSGTTVCSWSIGHDFIICQQTVIANANEQHDLAIYTYDEASRSYRFYNVGTGRVGSTTITVEPMQITYPGTFTEGDRTVTTRTLNLWDDDDHYHFSAAYSTDDGKTWTTMLTGVARRTQP